jgi:hypothetical protein
LERAILHNIWNNNLFRSLCLHNVCTSMYVDLPVRMIECTYIVVHIGIWA